MWSVGSLIQSSSMMLGSQIMAALKYTRCDAMSKVKSKALVKVVFEIYQLYTINCIHHSKVCGLQVSFLIFLKFLCSSILFY